jgi:hypothetical protein
MKPEHIRKISLLTAGAKGIKKGKKGKTTKLAPSLRFLSFSLPPLPSFAESWRQISPYVRHPPDN